MTEQRSGWHGNKAHCPRWEAPCASSSSEPPPAPLGWGKSPAFSAAPELWAGLCPLCLLVLLPGLECCLGLEAHLTTLIWTSSSLPPTSPAQVDWLSPSLPGPTPPKRGWRRHCCPRIRGSWAGGGFRGYPAQ